MTLKTQMALILKTLTMKALKQILTLKTLTRIYITLSLPGTL